MKLRIIFLIIICFLLIKAPFAQNRLTIIHTNDLHSELMGYYPTIDYTPGTLHDDTTVGGWARIATVINEAKKNRKNPVLIADAGDYTMGTLFHTICREEGLELHLLGAMGYDAVAIGNHEFDFMPGGLANMLRAAHAKGPIPIALLSNAVFSAESSKDDLLEDVFEKNIARTYTIIRKGNLKIGIFALLGVDAAEVSPFASPVKFPDRIESAKKILNILRNEEKADLIICLSHCGLTRRSGKESEDEELAKKVPGINIIISGHTHTKLEQPLVIGNTIIVQAWEYGKRVGILDLSIENGNANIESYQYIAIDDRIKGDPKIQRIIDAHAKIIENRILSPYGYSYSMAIAETSFDIPFEEKPHEYPMGNLIADSIKWYANKHAFDPKDPHTQIVAAIESSGLIRNGLYKGKTGILALCDIFKTFPLGIGFSEHDAQIGYPIVSVYLTAEEIKKALEVLTTIAPIKGNSYFLHVSGLKFTYNPHRMLFDRITNIWLGDETNGYALLDYSASNKKLYRVAANIYNATFLKIIGRFTSGILTIVPKDRNGNPIHDLNHAIIDRDSKTPGIQGLREWVGIIEYMKSFPDTDGDGIPNVPEMYRKPLGRIVAEPSVNPYALLRKGNWLTYSAAGALLLISGLIAIFIAVVGKKLRKKFSHSHSSGGR
ncbi:MAG: bifunctional metallophosphatase/5'-nucleotidase [Spirochaetes bacterium]|nr:bifunctional metallophosphatase/5'-nucleotidase [Spirochaetota bacterium]